MNYSLYDVNMKEFTKRKCETKMAKNEYLFASEKITISRENCTVRIQKSLNFAESDGGKSCQLVDMQHGVCEGPREKERADLSVHAVPCDRVPVEHIKPKARPELRTHKDLFEYKIQENAVWEFLKTPHFSAIITC